MSSEHVIDAKVRADTSNFSKGMSAVDKDLDKAGKGFSKYGTEAEKASKQTQSFVQANRGHMESLGKDAMLMGAGMLAGLGLAAKAAISWESAWAGVRKTTDGSPAEMAALEKELRGLAKTLPATHEEIAGVAEAAGQLGIQRGNVAAFTKTMIDLGESTNLSAEEAATGLARFSNVMGTNQKDASRLGSTLVGLGNNFATTESEILAMSMRLAGAGKQAGLTEGQVMGLAAGMSSVGIEAEAGGTAMSITMKRIGKAVDDGDDKLGLFAQTAGMTSEQFQKAWKDDASGALESFVVGLDKAGQSGESVNGILTELGITGIREADALLRLSAAGELMGDSMRQGGEEFTKGSALAEEAAKRYETTESKIKMAWNGIKDAAIDAGAVLLPVLRGIAETAAGLASAFGDLPEPVQGGLVAVVGITGATLLLGGALLTTIPRIYDTVKAVQALSIAAPRTVGVLTAVGKAAGIAAAAFIVLQAAAAASNSQRPAKSIEEMTSALIALTKGGKDAKEVFNKDMFSNASGIALMKDIEGIGEAFKAVNTHDAARFLNDVAKATIGYDSQVHILQKTLAGLDTGLANMASGGSLEQAAAAFRKITDEAESQGVGLEVAAKSFPEYLNSLRTLSNDLGVTLDDQELLNWALGETPAKMLAAQQSTEGQAKAAELAARQTEEQMEALDALGIAANGAILNLDKLVTSMIASGLISLSAKDAARAFEAAIDGLDESLKTNGTTLDITTEKGRANEAAFDGIAGAGLRSAEAMAKAGATQPEVQSQLQGTYDALIRAAEKFGITGDDADTMARKVMGIPKDVPINTAIQNYADTMAKAHEIKRAVDGIQGKSVDVIINHINRQIAGGGVAGDGASGTDPSMTAFRPGTFSRARGGDLDSAPGPKGVDSRLFYGAKGEHVLTDEDVDAMGGQSAVYAFRKQLHNAAARPMYAAPAPAAPAAMGGFGAGNLTVYVENPWTGEQVKATVRAIADNSADNAIGAANDDIFRGRAR